MTLVGVLVLMQAAGWRMYPAAPTVGDTIWVERTIEAARGWVVRPGPWETGGEVVEPLGPVVTVVEGAAVIVRYPLVAWEAGSHTLVPPPTWRVGPAGEADSVPGGSVTVAVSSLLPPDSVAPRPPRAPVERQPTAPVPVVVALSAGVGLMLSAWRWRRRQNRPAREGTQVATRGRLELTGDARVDAARLAARLRSALAVQVPAAHRALTTDECMDVVAAQRPEWPLAELGAVLRRLDDARFAPPGDYHMTALAEEVDALERQL